MTDDFTADPFVDAARRIVEKYDTGLDGATVNQLRALARAADLPGTSKMNKAQLRAAIRAELTRRANEEMTATPADDDQPDDQHADGDGCAACAAGSPIDNGPARLSPELTDGLTTWGTFGGAQMRVESPFVLDPETNEPLLNDDGSNVLAPARGALYIAFRDGAYQSNEEGNPWRLDITDARRLRDLLNIATARGVI